MEFSSELKTELPYDPVTPLLGVYPKKTLIWKDTCILKFIAALFTIAKTWKQPKCPSTEEWIKMMWCTHTMEYYSAIRMNKIMSFASTWINLEYQKKTNHPIKKWTKDLSRLFSKEEMKSVILTEVSQRKTNTIYHLQVKFNNNNKNGTNELCGREKQTHRSQNQIYGCGNLENSLSRGACQAIVCGVTKSWTWLSTHIHIYT